MNILIIEDERRNYNHLKRMLSRLNPAFRIEGPLPSIAGTLDWFRHHPEPDLILADIRLEDGLSFDALRQLNLHAPVIFTTAYDEYAIQAFKHNGLDYLLKPIDDGELADAIHKAERMLGQNTSVHLEQLAAEMDALRGKYRERFLLPWRDGWLPVRVNEISHFCTEDKMAYVCLKEGSSYATPFSLDGLEAQLNPRSFFRANRQYIIHIDSIAQIKHFFGAKLMVRLKGYPDVEVVISREKAADFKQWLNQ